MASPRLFARYVLNEAPTPNDVAAVLDALAPLLRRQMRHRGVWDLPPTAWGYAGRSWRDEETFNDLLSHCFAFVFTGRRLDRLREYASAQPSIDAAVGVSVRNFLNDKEREKDPAGHALFKNVQAAVSAGLAEGWLIVVGGAQDTITNQTVVAPPTCSATPEAELAAVAALALHLGPFGCASRPGPRGKSGTWSLPSKSCCRAKQKPSPRRSSTRWRPQGRRPRRHPRTRTRSASALSAPATPLRACRVSERSGPAWGSSGTGWLATTAAMVVSRARPRRQRG